MQAHPYAIREHEQSHVALFRSDWESMASEIKQFTDRCMSRGKANCYNSLVPKIVEKWATQANVDNLLFDCGDGNPEACQKLQPYSADLYGRLIPEVVAGLNKCAQIP